MPPIYCQFQIPASSTWSRRVRSGVWRVGSVQALSQFVTVRQPKPSVSAKYINNEPILEAYIHKGHPDTRLYVIYRSETIETTIGRWAFICRLNIEFSGSVCFFLFSDTFHLLKLKTYTKRMCLVSLESFQCCG